MTRRTRRTRWARLAGTATLYAAAGALLTVAVAWAGVALACFAPVLYDAGSKRADLSWPCPVPEDWPAPVGTDYVFLAGAECSTTYWLGGTAVKSRVVHSGKHGWPWKSMAWYCLTSGLPRFPPAGVRAGLPVPWHVDGLVLRLPLLPLPLPFAASTAFYALCLLLAIRLPGSVRRLRRRWRGLCPSCGYDLSGTPSGICPECGAAPDRGSGASRPPALG